MADESPPQIYLITPPQPELSTFPDLLARILDGFPIACLRLSLASHDESEVARTADVLRQTCHERDVAIVIEDHMALVASLGLDGVHFNAGARQVRDARKELGEDAIVGAFCGAMRHDAMNAAEAGADYVSLGPVGASALGDGTVAERDLFAWWSEMIEVPVVAEGNLTNALVADIAPVTDFFGIGSEIWRSDDPETALRALQLEMSG